MDYDLAIEWLTDFIDEDGYFSFVYSGYGTIEISCTDGECSVEVYKADDDTPLEGYADEAGDLYDAISAAVCELFEDDDDEVTDTLISHMHGSLYDDEEEDEEDEEGMWLSARPRE